MNLNWSDDKIETAEQWAKDNAELLGNFADACDNFVTSATELLELGEEMCASEQLDGDNSAFTYTMAVVATLAEILANQGPVYRSILEKGFQATIEEAQVNRLFQDRTN